jgi:hypothetical protein
MTGSGVLEDRIVATVPGAISLNAADSMGMGGLGA